MPLEELCDFVTRAASWGYIHLAISGGEPLLYSGLPELVAAGRRAGLAVSVITNGLSTRRVLSFVEASNLNAIAVSFDGLHDKHDRMRRKKGAFDAALDTLTELCNYNSIYSQDMNVGASVTVTSKNISSLPELVKILSATGVRNINFHPISQTGRAISEGDLALTEHDLLRLYLMVRALRTEIDYIAFSYDVFFPKHHSLKVAEGSLINPLVLSETGNLFPFIYNAPDRFCLGNFMEEIEMRVTKELFAWVENTATKLSSLRAANFYAEMESVAKSK